jgi:feruloyl esterase
LQTASSREFTQHVTQLNFLIPFTFSRPGSSVHYYEKVRAYMGGSDVTDSYRLFLVPGMGHCNGGAGANSFGHGKQQDDSIGGNGQSLVSDSKHDALLALMEWVEKDKAPEAIISASYIGGNRTQGVEFTRLLCPYPQVSWVLKCSWE